MSIRLKYRSLLGLGLHVISWRGYTFAGGGDDEVGHGTSV